MASSLRRLIKDHALLRNDPPPNYFFPDTDDLSSVPDDLTQLVVLITGAEGTPYSQGLWRLHLKMPQDYPRNPPKATFKTRIYHPNVDETTGAVCLETLKRDWDPKLTLKDILVTISCLLIQPNPDSALNAAAGALIQEDYDAFSKQAQLMTRIHAPIPPHLRHEVRVAKKRGEEDEDLAVVGSNADTLHSQCPSQQNDAQEDDTKENEPRMLSTDHLQANTKNKRPLADVLVHQDHKPRAENIQAKSEDHNLILLGKMRTSAPTTILISTLTLLASLTSAQSSSTTVEPETPLPTSSDAITSSSGSYENPFTIYTTQTDSLGVITGQPSVVTSQPELVTSQPAAATNPTLSGYWYGNETTSTSAESTSTEDATTTLATSTVPVESTEGGASGSRSASASLAVATGAAVSNQVAGAGLALVVLGLGFSML
ncbi:hypothetical protein B0A52_02206 [Exophiala mesophila]|uniref:UBC core domain-containing protein n=1 Tax=Exophiala mesophila TaxID=212818 RepID=A0A438NBP7_EXOME|nr:hypothetical protein B0A52_02206 [Exophiala mesophila]